jgi:hypothetical protein
MGISFLTPLYLWLLPAVFVLARWPRTGTRSRRAFVLRATALVCVVLALARPVVTRSDERRVFVAVVDASESASGDDTLATLAAAGADFDTRLLVRFGSDAALTEEARLPFDAAFELGAAGDFAAALECAGALVPTGVRGAVAIASDGTTRSDEHGRAAQALIERGLAVSYRGLDTLDFGARPIAITPLGTLRAGHTGRVRVHGFGAPDEVVLRAGGELLASAAATRDGTRFDAILEFEVPVAAALQVEAMAGGAATRALLALQPPLPVLYVGTRQIGGADALATLLGPGFAVRPFASTGTGGDASDQALGESLAEFAERLESAPLVLVDDAPADRLPAGALDLVANAVRARGTGLVMAGGSAAFGPGGYADTPLEELLPIDFVQREEKRDPSTTLVVIIDTSGSMGGERVQLAKEVARLAIARLLPHDKVGIVEFYGAKRWAAPIQPASNHIELERALNRLDAGGGTVIMPAIEEAFYGLQNVDTRYKHVLVLTDGGVERGAFEPLLRQMAEKAITVSTVLVGGNLHSEFLVDIANWGKGRFYSVPNRFNLPEVLLKQPTSAQLPAYRTGEYALEGHGGAQWWGGEREEQLPTVQGYVESELKDGAEVVLSIAETGQPLVSSWMFGAGRTGAFTSEPLGAGTVSFASWPGYGRFLGRFLARCASPDAGVFRFEARRNGHEVVVVATERFPTEHAPMLVNSPRGAGEFVRVARDRHELRFVADDAAAVLEFGQRAPSGAIELVERAALAPRLRPERDVDHTTALPFERIAAATGGRELAPGGEAPAATRVVARASLRLAPLFALIALLVFLVDVLLRRLPTNRAGYSS